jgi:U3 small nucleolar RNA-associated protein 13
MRLWSLEGACLRLFEGHSASVLRIAFATFGTQLMTSGGDSLVKVWTVRTGECNTTLDKHSDKLWSIAVANNGEKIATGGSDASVLVWRDATEQHAKEAAAREEERTQKQQKLENAMVSREYANAVELALQLERPLSLLDVFKRLLRSEGEETAQEVLKGLDKETLGRCIDFAREWNTNSKSCEVAHRLLQCVFHTFSPSMLSTLPRCIDNVDAMLPYSQRCVQRLLPFISFPLIEVAMNMCNETYVAGTFLVLIDF